MGFEGQAEWLGSELLYILGDIISKVYLLVRTTREKLGWVELGVRKTH